MLMVASRRQRKVRVLQITCCCWFSRQRPLHTHRREASAESLTPAISTGPTYSTSRPACVLCRIARPIGDSDEQDPKLCQTQPAFPSTFSRHWGRALLLRRCLAQVVRRYRLSRNFFCGDIFEKTHCKAQRAHTFVQDVSSREARQDPIAQATESAPGTFSIMKQD